MDPAYVEVVLSRVFEGDPWVTFHVVVRNTGQNTAQDISFYIEGDMPIRIKTGDDRVPFKPKTISVLRIFGEKIDYLPPGNEMRTPFYFDRQLLLLDQKENFPADYYAACTIRVSYKDEKQMQHYEHAYNLLMRVGQA